MILICERKNHLGQALSGVKSYGNLYCIEELKKFVIKVNKDAFLEYECLKQNDLFSTIKGNTTSDDTTTIIARNMRSLSKIWDAIVSDDRIYK